MKENILIDKSIEFAARIIKLERYLVKDKKETVPNEEQKDNVLYSDDNFTNAILTTDNIVINLD